MCGIVGFLDRLDRPDFPTGRVILAMLDALGCRGPDSAGAALLRSDEIDGVWAVRIAPGDVLALTRLESLGVVERVGFAAGPLRFRPLKPR